MQTASLRKYRSVYKLSEVPASSSKDELIPAVARHFAAQVSLGLGLSSFHCLC